MAIRQLQITTFNGDTPFYYKRFNFVCCVEFLGMSIRATRNMSNSRFNYVDSNFAKNFLKGQNWVYEMYSSINIRIKKLQFVVITHKFKLGFTAVFGDREMLDFTPDIVFSVTLPLRRP